MKSIPASVWRELQLAIAQFSDNASLRDFLDVLLSWVRGNSKLMELESFSLYGFKEFIEVDEDSMPIGFSSVTHGDIAHFKKAILGYSSRDAESIARFLRDTLEALITVEVNEKCPNCENDWMRAFIGRNNGRLAYQCDVCGCSRYSDGTRVEAGGLVFVSEEKLRGFGLI
ncbi:hypothetical protein [Pseudomonas protegens]|uniref:hypothetical protein n=2 Tax=Pseudomonas protegens TaxID=380021 RepID=UPI001B316CC8|nr:hypothetical protein [Pseudomonas protegens]MBP5100943.1 hypothetical protein [Pseudomonas protegens]MBP5120595.1 hypothetical protein [Pseudomonas protegens]QTU04226.1 hypothetical protein HUT25_00180 [Pseudomonas protegens]QTU10536.1 hypothetical protein HUT23_00870 [Pseudomonas protegens]QTU22524.1 hypothetical protein HUT22_31725 [Pseudomonas protegens]